MTDANYFWLHRIGQEAKHHGEQTHTTN